MAGKVWDYMDKLGPEKARCNLCKKTLSRSNGGPTGIKLHLEKKYGIKCAKEETPSAPSAARQSIIDQLSKPPKKEMNLEKKSKLDRLLLDLVVYHNLAFSILESDTLQSIFDLLLPGLGYKPPSRRDISEVLLPKAAEEVKDDLRQLFKSEPISITTDGYTDNGVSYYAVTAHSVDDNFTRHNEVLACVPCSDVIHTAENLVELTQKTLADYEVDQLVGFTHDAAANMVKTGKLVMKDDPAASLNCEGHLFHNVVRTCEKTSPELEVTIKKAKTIVKYFKRSPYKQTVLYVWLDKIKKLFLDVDTRWNSTLEMVKEVLAQEEAIAYALIDLWSQKHPTPDILTSADTELLKGYVKYTEISDELTRELSSDLATAAMYLPYLQLAITKTRGLLAVEISEPMRELGDFLLCGLEKAATEHRKNPFLQESACFDPRLYLKPGAFSNSQWDSIEARIIDKIVEKECSSPESPLVPPTTATASKPGRFSSLDGPQPKRLKTIARTTEQEVLRTKIEGEFFTYKKVLINVNMDDESVPFKFWKENAKDMPRLAAAARRHLCVPPTSVSSERLFSRASLILRNKLRNRLRPERVEMLLLLLARRNARAIAKERAAKMTERDILEKERSLRDESDEDL